MSRNYPRQPIAIIRGEGCYLYDAEGRRYLDLFAGFGAGLLGHCHPDLVEAVTQQARTLWHTGNLLHTEPQTLLAEAIWRHGFGGRSFFCHSGADANEAAFKLARLYGKAKPAAKGRPTPASPLGRFKIIAATGSFHGRTFGTMVATGQEDVRQGFEPLLPGFLHVPYNNLPAVERAIDEETIAIVVEPIQGEGGMNLPDDSYLPGLRQLCDERDLLLILDEVWTGCGRTGRYFAHQHWGVEPDIMTLAKGVGGGLPVGVMCAKPHVAELYDWSKYGKAKHATTLGGNCIAMAAAATVFKVLQRDGLVERADHLGRRTLQRLSRLIPSCPAVRAVRGKGLFIGIELNPAAKGATFKTVGDVVKRCLDLGVIIQSAQKNVLRLAPPLTISESLLDEGLAVIERALQGV